MINESALFSSCSIILMLF